MNEEQGLAQQGAQAQQQQMLDQVVQMLMQGMSPEELQAQGVPAQLIQMAMQIVEQQQQQQGQMQPQGQVPEGLAGMTQQGL